jgi:hypothetical protein
MENGLYMVSNEGRLFRLDCASGTAGAIGNIGVANVTDLAFQGPTLWGLTFDRFLRIDPRTGGGTVIAPTGQADLNGLAVSMDGVIYTAGFANSQLLRIDPVTGAAAAVGNFGGGLTLNGDLAFDSNNVLYAALTQGANVVLGRINLATGAAAVIGNIGFATCYGLAFHACRLYGVTDAGEVITINCATGAGSLIGRSGIQQWGLAASCTC